MRNRRTVERGLTLIETIIGIAIISIVAFSVYRGYIVLLDTYALTEARIAAATIANQEMELIRNLEYKNIGTVGGIPSGIIPAIQTKTKEGHTFTVTTAIRNIDDPYDGTLGGSPGDTSPADYKLVELSFACDSCAVPNIFSFAARVAPKGLETASANGALFVQVIDANGLPVAGATVQVVNSSVAPAISITDVTDSTGFLKIVDVPPSVQSYQITVSKAAYSQDQTYAPSVQNPNPIKVHSTVAAGQITQATFAIDRISSLAVSSLSEACQPVSGANFVMTGVKLIGTNPDVPKFSQSFATDANGAVSVGGVEWDNYSFSVTHATNDLRGTIPLPPLNIVPNSSQNLKFILEPKNPSALLITVKDAATGLPLTNASVTLTGGSYANTQTTGRGAWRQTDWSGGSGQLLFIDSAKYDAQDGNIDILSPAGELKLITIATSTYASSGVLTSSVFDAGSASNFYDIFLAPQSQTPDAGPDSLRVQIATATTSVPASWNFLGPDGTGATYYTAALTGINSIHNGDRYARYQVYLGTASSTFTPNLSDFALTFASACVPPGQVLFSGLTSQTYNLSVNLAGYQPYNGLATVNFPWQETVVSLSQ